MKQRGFLGEIHFSREVLLFRANRRGTLMNEEKKRFIQEYVPGKQITLAHLIAKPQKSLYKRLGLAEDSKNAIGILTITPGEAAIIAADTAIKAANVEIGFVDRFSGSLVITGEIGCVEASIKAVLTLLTGVLRFSPADITRS